mmetsp:Transcript_28576/g.44734  ORF Transcript_28576/g.44734 Transcript_28576/m.44734 type:complete len:537 (-) Transcript_28576:382-1992(-)
MREVAMKGADEEEGDLRIFRSPEPKICGVPRRVFYFMLCGLLVCAAVGAGIGVALEPSGRALAAKQGDNVGQADPPEIKTYTYLPYDVIVDKLLDLQTRFPHFVEVFTTQERYGLGTRGTCTLQGTNQGCKVYVIRIANKQLLTPSTPEVFFSGTLHGNERIGPTAVTEFATYLLEMYNFDTWAKRLVDTRAITIVPAANAVGYAHNTREEEGIDANRDFAWNQDSGHCFKTIAARSINELWREHLFQLSITFHGGDHMVAYPWGDYLHCNGLRCSEGGWTAPDETGMKDLVDNIRSFVGSYNSGKDGYYKVGALNDIIYPVHGGMEDWAYGASWESGGSVECAPGGYAGSKSAYNNVTHRGINLLVETSFDKIPSEAKLGTSKDVLTIGGGHATDGYIPRNMRLCWVLTDVIQPWLTILNSDELPSSITEEVPVNVKWEAGGAFKIDTAEIVCLDAQGVNKCSSQEVTNLNVWHGGAKRGQILTEFSVPTSSGVAPGTSLRVKMRSCHNLKFTICLIGRFPSARLTHTEPGFDAG